MRGAIPPPPQYAVMAWCLVKAQGQLYIYFAFNKRKDEITQYAAPKYILLSRKIR
jgi:hypothetical protein